MILVGRYLSPFVRRVATTLQWLNIPYDHRSLSPALDADAVRPFNPMLKVPVLVLDDGETLIESGAIIESILETVDGQTLLPASGATRRRVLQQCGLMTNALDKAVAALYEKTKRPKEKIHQPFLDGLVAQSQAGLDQIEAEVAAGGFHGPANPTVADITAAVGYTFISAMLPEACSAERHPTLAALAKEFEQTEAFKACQFKV